MSVSSRAPSFKVGDRVKVPFGFGKATGIVVEDRGAIGIRGRRLFQVEIPMDPYEPMALDLPEEEIEPADERVDEIEAARIAEYLIHGGLIMILRSNLSGGRSQPRVWLSLDNLGNVTHTFIEERGVVGGQTVPFWLTQGDKIFLPKRDSAIAYVESFGLDRPMAEHVVQAVGTMP